MTLKQIRKTTGMDTMFRTHKSGQLTENCVFFDDILPGVFLSVSLIKKNPIKNNADFCVQEWYESKNDLVKMRLSELFIKQIIPNNDSIKQRERFIHAEIQRVFTCDPVDDGDGDNIAYLIQVRYKPGWDLKSLKNMINSLGIY